MLNYIVLCSEMEDENRNCSTSLSNARMKRKLILQGKRIKATCVQHNRPPKRTKSCTPLSDITSSIFNQQLPEMEIPMHCRRQQPMESLKNSVHATTTEKNKKSNRQNLLQKFVATVNMVIESSGPHHIHGSSGINSPTSIQTESIHLEDIDENGHEEDNVPELCSPITSTC